MNSAWMEELENVVATVESCLISAGEFTALLDRAIRLGSSPLLAIEITLEDITGSTIVIGKAGPAEPDCLETISLTGFRHRSAKLRLWFHHTTVAGDQVTLKKIVTALLKAFSAWWIPGGRSSKGDLPMYTEETKRRGQSTLTQNRSKGGAFTVLFCDLDNFKQINNHGQAQGDIVIGRMASFLENAVSQDGVVIHAGGDEFLIVLPDGANDDGIDLAARIINDATNYDFDAKDVPISFSFGIASISEYPSATFDALVAAADTDALKKLVKSRPEVKGAMRVSGNVTSPATWDINPSVLALTIRWALGRPPATRAFLSSWLNALVKTGRRALREGRTLVDAGNIVLQTYRAFKIPLSSSNISHMLGASSQNTEPSLSALDIAVAFARVILEHHLLKSTEHDGKRLVVNRSETTTTLSVGDIVVLRIDAPAPIALELDLGVNWKFEGSPESLLQPPAINSSPFILVEIGRSHLHLLSRLAADHIVVDDRPGRGGGLPDFWELSLSRLISSISKLPNVERVIVFGDMHNAPQTVSQLKNAADWNLDHLTYKTAVQKDLVEEAQKRITGCVTFFSTEIDALDSLLDIARAPKTLEQARVNAQTNPHTRLRRTLDASSVSLRTMDGCRVRSAAEAYPLVLELLRSNEGDDDLITDQDGIQLRELVDFKVVVENVDSEQVPLFFQKDMKQLETYFESQFMRDDGRFAREIKAKGYDLRVLHHVRWAITRPDGKPFATRRALLVIPHEPSTSPDGVAPLGLVSIRLLPRPITTETIVNFSFTWRTVEALIGFPYSLYGSLRYSQYLFNELSRLCPAEKLRLGYVSYLAHSLHFFVSEESRRIARGIVSESSL